MRLYNPPKYRILSAGWRAREIDNFVIGYTIFLRLTIIDLIAAANEIKP